MTDWDEPIPMVPGAEPPDGPVTEWAGLSAAERYRRLAQVAEGFALLVTAASESTEFLDAVLDLRDVADGLLNGSGEFAYFGPAECWERNLPLSAVGWRWPGTVGR